MAGETYYFFFSLIAVFTTTFSIVNFVYLRLKGKTLFGQSFKKGTPEYKRAMNLVDNQKLAILAIVELGFIANLVYDFHRIRHLSDQEYAHSILVYAPIAVLLFSILMFFVARKQAVAIQSMKR